ncbi:type II toxin-antitoxin system VapC family toxin [Cyclobacterium roseum]|uniref:type II toxin-antitoxin system VapC family toxin n=1 Tax=Cyclobacterium roseum TaxID=2666137 RepID=UPI001390D525|nr:PIN domain-containing protein [Cyclobacterium roseum]
MKHLFLDTNVILSFHFADAEKHQQKAIDYIFNEIERKRWTGHISLITFYQLLYFIDRKINNPKTAAQRAYAYLAILQITPFNPSFLSALNFDLWPDYEDGLQYCCAQSGACEIIITTNSPDFFASDLPVIDPLNFVLQHQ